MLRQTAEPGEAAAVLCGVAAVSRRHRDLRQRKLSSALRPMNGRAPIDGNGNGRKAPGTKFEVPLCSGEAV